MKARNHLVGKVRQVVTHNVQNVCSKDRTEEAQRQRNELVNLEFSESSCRMRAILFLFVVGLVCTLVVSIDGFVILLSLLIRGLDDTLSDEGLSNLDGLRAVIPMPFGVVSGCAESWDRVDLPWSDQAPVEVDGSKDKEDKVGNDNGTSLEENASDGRNQSKKER